MSILSRFRRQSPAVDDRAVDVAPTPEEPVRTVASQAARPATREPTGIACPYCAALVDPPPPRNRLCPRCRRLIVVRRTGGRTVYLTEAAVEVFEEERRREASVAAWTSDRTGWLRLAAVVGAPEDRIRRLDGRPVSADVVADAKALYLAAAAKVVKAASRAGHWDDVARIEREQVAALYREAGSPVPPPEDLLALHRHAMASLLRSLKAMGTHAEVVGGSCCAACKRDGGRIFPIVEELRAPRLPHDGCPRGLCPCEWWLGGTPPKRRRKKARPRADVVDAPAAAVPDGDDPGPDGDPAPALDAAPAPGIDAPRAPDDVDDAHDPAPMPDDDDPEPAPAP